MKNPLQTRDEIREEGIPSFQIAIEPLIENENLLLKRDGILFFPYNHRDSILPNKH